jgi:predicted outer membrane lipoprotein
MPCCPARRAGRPEDDGLAAQMRSAGRSDNLLFSHEAEPSGRLDTWLLPRFQHEFVIDNVSQPTVLSFEQQLAWHDLLTAEFLIIIGLLACAFVTVPALSLRHFRPSNAAPRAGTFSLPGDA